LVWTVRLREPREREKKPKREMSVDGVPHKHTQTHTTHEMGRCDPSGDETGVCDTSRECDIHWTMIISSNEGPSRYVETNTRWETGAERMLCV
jgi:hypothetical protein